MYDKVYSVNTELDIVTGVEKVMMDIHFAIKHDFQSYIVGFVSYDKVNADHNISQEEYVRFRNPFMFKNSIIIIHERKLLLLFFLIKLILLGKTKIVYIHHNVFHDKKLLTVLPQNIVAIADRGIENLTNFFGAKRKNITKIYNCVQDIKPQEKKYVNKEYITILYPARINETKRQIDVVKKLKGKLNHNIKILFAGTGRNPIYQEFLDTIKDDNQFISLGYRNDVHKLMQECDYMLLFSSHEGLPITLIEAAMCGTPIICNDVGGNTEIAKNGENALVVNEWNELIETLNKLPEMSDVAYDRMCKHSRQIYEENFTFETFRKNYLKLLKDIA